MSSTGVTRCGVRPSSVSSVKSLELTPASHNARVLDFTAECAKQRSDALDFADSRCVFQVFVLILHFAFPYGQFYRG